MRLTARPATRADILRWHPEASCSFKAWVCEVNDEPAGIIGVGLSRPVATLFSAFEDSLKPHLKSMAVLRLIKRAQAICRESRLPVFALVDPEEGFADTAPIMLARLGFEQVGEHENCTVWRFA